MLDQITINEHSSIRIGGGPVVYVDPFRLKEEPHDADLILFTHPHFDHFSPEDFVKAAKADTHYVCPHSMRAEALAAGIPAGQLTAMEAEENLGICGIEIEAVPAYNINKKFHPRENRWLGYVLEIGRDMIYIAGDTDDISEGRCVDCTVALVPIGGTYTMTPKEAAHFVNTMHPHVVIPTHYGTVVGKPEDVREFARLLAKDIELCIKLPE